MRKHALVISIMLAAAAHADSKTAAVHDRQAKAYFDAKQYDAAIDEFKKSYAQDKKPITLFKIASAYYAKADFAAAIDHYGQYLLADPDGPYAQQAIEFTTIAKRALDDAKAKDDLRKQEDAAKLAAAERDKQRLVAAGRIKNAEAFAKEGAWTSAGDEYRAATEIDGDAAHLLDAAEAYRKQPDHAKASEAYRAYLEKVPSGANSDEARAKLAESARALEAEAAERKRVAGAAPAPAERRDDVPKGPPPITKGWSSYGPRAAIGFSQPDTNPLMMRSGDGLVAKPSFDVGAFARYQLHGHIAIRPEASIIYRSVSFDVQPAPMQPVLEEALVIKRAGLAIAAPIYFALKDTNGLRLGVGPFAALMPYFSSKHSSGFAFDAGDGNKLDYGLLAAIEVDFGLVSVEARFSKSFGTHSEPVEATMYTLLAGLAFGFEPARK